VVLLREDASPLKARIVLVPTGKAAPPGADRIIEFEAGKTDGLRSALAGLEIGKRPERKLSTDQFELYNEWGIGDELLLSAVAREIRRERPDARVWIRGRHGFRYPAYVECGQAPSQARRVETIYQNPTLYGPGAHSPYPGHLVEQMLAKFTLDTGIAVRAEDLRPELEGPRWKPSAPARRSVVLHSKPNPRLSSKDWGHKRWESLCGLLHKDGVEILQVGAPGEPLLPYARDLRGTAVSDLQEVLAQAGAVVSVVGFLMHLAAATGTPAVVIYGGREHPAIDGYPDQIHLGSEALACKGRWGCHLGPDLDCPHAMKCMESIPPEWVAEEVLGVLGRGGPS
jgi:ADP-heptose:LPS heptosyltransferase